MDSLSNKIEMQFKLDLSKQIDKNLVVSKNRKLLADVEGELRICIGDSIFFQEKYILLLELGIQLIKWVSDINKGTLKNFIYETMDYSEGPLLEFIVENDHDCSIQSQWEMFHAYSKFSIQELAVCSQRFLQELSCKLKEAYKIDFNDYLMKYYD